MIYMKACFTMCPIDLGNSDVIKALVAEASAEGFQFIDRLVGEWHIGVNRFSKPGEKLLGVFDGQMVIAVGGLKS